MKKTGLRVLLINMLFVVLSGGVWKQIHTLSADNMKIYVQYGEEHANWDGGTSQLFYAQGGEEFSEENSVMCSINGNGMYVVFELPELDLADTNFRLDPFMNEENFSVIFVYVVSEDGVLLSMPEGEFVKYIDGVVNCEYMLTGDRGVYVPQNRDPALYISRDFNDRIIDAWENEIVSQREKEFLWCVIWFCWLEMGAILFTCHKKANRIPMTKGHFFALVVADILLVLGGMLNYGVSYLMTNFGNVRVEELLFNMTMPLEGTNVSSFDKLFWGFGVIALGATLIVFGVDFLVRRLHWKKGYASWISVLGVIAGTYAIVIVSGHFDLISYWKFLNEKTTLYEEYYVDGRDVQMTFPEEKRNLIYIYLESMETTYASRAAGGAMGENYIPELTALASENIDFSGNAALNGAHTLSGTTFTTGAIVAHTAGVPVNTSFISNDTANMWTYGDNCVLPGVWTIGDVLNEQGYRQMFMIGSNGVFGGRAAYMKAHGGYAVKDYYAAIEEGKIADGYYVWWGYEDEKLVTYAKEELLALAEEKEPFNFTMLTVDTHFTDGYLCEKCGNAYEDQYSNVIACSSAMIGELIEWIKNQDFYENTTIVIAGDHLTMDSDYIARNNADNYDRRAYFTIINPADGCEEAETRREYSTFDIYPTTLAALGVDIEGNRLGLGVNLFSDETTLYEQYGADYLNEELLKNSDFYISELMQ